MNNSNKQRIQKLQKRAQKLLKQAQMEQEFEQLQMEDGRSQKDAQNQSSSSYLQPYQIAILKSKEKDSERKRRLSNNLTFSRKIEGHIYGSSKVSPNHYKPNNNSKKYQYHQQHSSFVTDPELIKKCLELTHENAKLKSLLNKQKDKSDKLQQYLKNLKQKQAIQQEKINQNLKKIEQKSKKTMQKQLQQFIYEQKIKFQKELKKSEEDKIKTKIQLQDAYNKMKRLQSLLENEAIKSRKLVNFIKVQLPNINQQMIKITSKVQGNLEKYFSRDLNYI